MRFITLIVCLIVPFALMAQQPTREELETQRQNIMEAIKQTQIQLEATKQNKNATMAELRALQAKLRARQRLIGNINAEMAQISNNIQHSNQEVAQLRSNLDVLKMRYAQSVRHAYKSRSSYDMLAFLFSASDFNDALRRMKYLKKYRENRKEQAQQIRLTQGKIVRKIDALNAQKSEKDVLLSAEEQQKLVLQKETQETNNVVNSLKGKEKELVAEIQKNRKATQRLDKAVQDIIRHEMEIARKKAEEEQRRREEEERRRKEEEQKRTLAANPDMNSNRGATRPATGSVPTTNRPAATTTGRPATATEKPVVASSAPATRPKPAPTYNYSMTPEAAALSNNFEANRGRLPWPVEKGFISMGYGTHKHPVAEKVTIENFGVDITTNPGATARSVFEGTVTKVFYIQGRNWNVLINHGKYYTLYSYLSNVSVKADQKVSTKQSIGTVGQNDEGVTLINLQIWKDGNKTNPEPWIAR